MSVFFDDALGKVKNVADAAGKKTNDLVEFSKLKVALTDVNKEINRGYMRLGKITYEKASKGVESDEAAEIIGEIDALNEKLAGIHDRILAIKNVIRCPECAAINPRQAIFCNQCGALIKIPAAEPENAAEDVAEDIAEEAEKAAEAVEEAVETVVEAVEEEIKSEE